MKIALRLEKNSPLKGRTTTIKFGSFLRGALTGDKDISSSSVRFEQGTSHLQLLRNGQNVASGRPVSKCASTDGKREISSNTSNSYSPWFQRLFNCRTHDRPQKVKVEVEALIFLKIWIKTATSVKKTYSLSKWYRASVMCYWLGELLAWCLLRGAKDPWEYLSSLLQQEIQIKSYHLCYFNDDSTPHYEVCWTWHTKKTTERDLLDIRSRSSSWLSLMFIPQWFLQWGLLRMPSSNIVEKEPPASRYRRR